MLKNLLKDNSCIFLLPLLSEILYMSKVLFCTFCILLIVPTIVLCQEAELTPDGENIKIIGTRYSVDYSTGQQSETVNTKSNAFDCDFSTIFASYDRSYTWLGLDLGQRHIITRVAFCPRQGYSSRLLLGVFEGANSEDFIEAVPLGIIRSAPYDNTMTELEINNSRGFRYVRYISPNDVRCNIAEIAFYGYPGEGNDSLLTQTSNIPDVIIHTIDATEVTSRDTYIEGVISFISKNGKNIYTDSLEIRGRGNASWNFPKKPYRIKLFNAASPLGCPAHARNWTLINNYGDKTLIRNLIAFDLSRRFEMPYTPAGKLVNVYFNGEFKGCYQFCDHIDIRPGRVDITEMEKEETSGTALTGGYLIEVDNNASGEPLHFYSARNGIPVTIRRPDFDAMSNSGDPRRQYITAFFNSLETDVFNSNANYWRNRLDANTFVRHFLVGELSGNTDTYYSLHLSKEREENLFRVGPVWDFDIAFENDRRTTPINAKSDWICKTNGSFAANSREMFVKIINSMTTDLQNVWSQYRNSRAISWDSISSVIDDYENEIDESQKLNFTRWDILSQIVHENYQALGSYKAELDVVRNYLSARIGWIDNKLGYVASVSNEPDDKIKIWTTDDFIRVDGITERSSIEIFDLAGRKIRSEETSSSISIPITKFVAGVYIVTVKIYESGRQKRTKIKKLNINF